MRVLCTALVALVLSAPSFAASSPGTPWSWGFNNYRQLGDATSITRALPVQVVALTNVIAIDGGAVHTIALKSDGTVWTWGSNYNGQLGDFRDEYQSSIPGQVPGLSDVVAVAGSNHNLALKSDGTVWAWGLSGSGQLGDASLSPRYHPGQVSGIDHVVAIAAGYRHSLALKSDGTVWAWGNNAFGELGNGTTEPSNTPIQVHGLTGVTAISSGGGLFSLALRSDGSVWAWGDNTFGQHGDGTTVSAYGPPPVNLPNPVSGLTDVTSIFASWEHALALRSDGTVVAWGRNIYGQIGDGTGGWWIQRNLPVSVSGLPRVIAVAAGIYHSLALDADGTVWAWGDNKYGQSGDGTATQQHNTPVRVRDLSGVGSIAAGGYHSLALIASNRPPVANTDSYDVDEDGLLMVPPPGVVGNDTDADGNELTAARVSGAAHGALSLNPDGSFSYTPFPDYHGLDSFGYKAKDGQAESDVASVILTVTAVNDAPAMAAIGDSAVDEGTLLTIVTVGSDVDEDLLTYSASNLPAGAAFDPSTRTFSWTPGFAQAGSYPGVRFHVTDGSLTASEAATITVNDVNRAPSIVSVTTPADPVRIGTLVAAGVAFADSDTDDTHTGVFDWGDGTGSPAVVDEKTGSGTARATHVYATAGVYQVIVRIVDRFGASAERSSQLITIYDPDAGFVTGGGWISSPVGAYAADPTVTGKATFAFTSRYQKGASVPSGHAGFQFDVANLSFASSASYEWLVIAGGRAQCKAVGTINGAGEYGFLLIAIDGDYDGGGGADKVRIKIWNGATGATVYDNKMGASERGDDATELSGGSILVHK